MKTPSDSLALKFQSEHYPARYNGKVPRTVKLLKRTTSDFPFLSSFLVCEKDSVFPVWVNSHGAVAAIHLGDDMLGLKPDEFEVIEWHVRKHIPEIHKHCPREGYCWICDGGLFACVVCKGAEGSLTTDCPGIELDGDIQDEIYKHGLDYTEAAGWYYK